MNRLNAEEGKEKVLVTMVPTLPGRNLTTEADSSPDEVKEGCKVTSASLGLWKIFT